jgi:putative DNA primase/helicase
VAEGEVLLSAASPYDTAKEFARREGSLNGALILYFWQGQFWRWNGRFYQALTEDVMRSQIYKFLDAAQKWAGSQTVRFQPKPRNVNDVLDCLKAVVALGVECAPPMWLDTKTTATEMIVFRNGIVNVLTGAMQGLSPRLWVHGALSFDWQPASPCPTWDKFLADVFPGDQESKDVLEEWMGYCMTEETKFQKGAMLMAKTERQRHHQRRIEAHSWGRIICRAELQHLDGEREF